MGSAFSGRTSDWDGLVGSWSSDDDSFTIRSSGSSLVFQQKDLQAQLQCEGEWMVGDLVSAEASIVGQLRMKLSGNTIVSYLKSTGGDWDAERIWLPHSDPASADDILRFSLVANGLDGSSFTASDLARTDTVEVLFEKLVEDGASPPFRIAVNDGKVLNSTGDELVKSLQEAGLNKDSVLTVIKKPNFVMEMTSHMRNTSVSQGAGRPDAANGVTHISSMSCDRSTVARVLFRSDGVCALLWHETLTGKLLGSIPSSEDAWYLLSGTWQVGQGSVSCDWNVDSFQCRYNNMLGACLIHGGLQNWDKHGMLQTQFASVPLPGSRGSKAKPAATGIWSWFGQQEEQVFWKEIDLDGARTFLANQQILGLSTPYGSEGRPSRQAQQSRGSFRWDIVPANFPLGLS